ncbi:receptor-like protein EIX2 [Aristolochia californica]|uniref:receptor-like protein EIX2 n=1 Tax=Aristolochia californica TaxID=171875 RepID=UPI0035D79B19
MAIKVFMAPPDLVKASSLTSFLNLVFSNRTSCVQTIKRQEENEAATEQETTGKLKKLDFLVRVFSVCVLCNRVHSSQVGCSDSERAALTKFKRKLIDPSNVLTSWGDSPDCCQWNGVACHNETGYVVQLDLHHRNLSGDVDPALTELKHLKYLDLSGNHFDGVKIPEFFGSLKELKHLNISYAGFGGRIPHHLGNLSYLELLDVSSSLKSYSNYMYRYNSLIYSSSLNADSLDWMINMPLLKHLEMNFVNLSIIGSRWFHVMNSLSSLQILQLRSSYLSDIPPALPFTNLTQLRSLDLSYNQFFSEIPNWFANITTLVSIDLNANKFYGDMSSKFPTLPCLEELHLGSNYGLTAHLSKLFQGPWKSIKVMFLFDVQLYGELPESIGNLSSLQHLILGVINGNQVIKGIPRQIGHLHNLKGLMLYGFEDQTGSMREWLCPLVNLQILYIQNCHFPESIPTCLGGFSSLITLILRNSMLKGPMLQEHFQNLSRLQYIDLSSNSFEFHTPLDWVPSFQAEYIYLGSCRFGSQFPLWLQSQKKLYGLDLSNSSSSIIPSWFWNITPRLSILILRMNNISGSLPTKTILTLSNAWLIDLSHNYFKGLIPYFTSPLMFLDLSHNQFSGVLPSMFNEMKLLGVLDLSHNNLTGGIPKSLASCESLIVLNLGANNFSGSIPWSSVQFTMMRSLHLENNQLSGVFPSFLKDCAGLQTLDFGENKFTGSLPAWIGTNLPNLRILLLRSNKFTGTIPHLLNLHHLKVFDLSNNHLLGSIPESLKDLMAMKMDHTTDNTMDTNYGNYRDRVELTMNGQQYEYENTLYLVISLDILGNNLSGKIPEAIGDLLGLINLNLSGNQLSGKIPESIGNLHQLINLDLSKNHLFGMIPSTIADLTFLSHLNLSYNNLSGKIPLGQQVQSLDDPSIYAGNDNLCGYPLIRDCERDTIVPLPSHNEVDDGSDIAWLYAGIGPGFAVGLLTVFGILLFKTSWRVKYFKFVDAMQEYFHCWVCTIFLLRMIMYNVMISLYLHKLARYIDGQVWSLSNLNLMVVGILCYKGIILPCGSSCFLDMNVERPPGVFPGHVMPLAVTTSIWE